MFSNTASQLLFIGVYLMNFRRCNFATPVFKLSNPSDLCRNITTNQNCVGMVMARDPCLLKCLCDDTDACFNVYKPNGEECINDNPFPKVCFNSVCLRQVGTGANEFGAACGSTVGKGYRALVKKGEPCTLICLPPNSQRGARAVEMPAKPGSWCIKGTSSGYCEGNRCEVSNSAGSKISEEAT